MEAIALVPATVVNLREQSVSHDCRLLVLYSRP